MPPKGSSSPLPVSPQKNIRSSRSPQRGSPVSPDAQGVHRRRPTSPMRTRLEQKSTVNNDSFSKIVKGDSYTFVRFGKRLNCYNCRAELELLDYCNDKGFKWFHVFAILLTGTLGIFGLHITGVGNLKNIARWNKYFQDKGYAAFFGMDQVSDELMDILARRNDTCHGSNCTSFDSGFFIPNVSDIIKMYESEIGKLMCGFLLGSKGKVGIATGIVTAGVVAGAYTKNMLKMYYYKSMVTLYKSFLERLNQCDEYWCAKKVCGSNSDIVIYNNLFNKPTDDENPDGYFTYEILKRENKEKNSKPLKGEKITLKTRIEVDTHNGSPFLFTSFEGTTENNLKNVKYAQQTYIHTLNLVTEDGTIWTYKRPSNIDVNSSCFKLNKVCNSSDMCPKPGGKND